MEDSLFHPQLRWPPLLHHNQTSLLPPARPSQRPPRSHRPWYGSAGALSGTHMLVLKAVFLLLMDLLMGCGCFLAFRRAA